MQRNVDKYFEENKAYSGLGRASVNSGLTLVAARGLNVFVQLAATILLARLLDPDDFGLVAIVLAMVGIAPLLVDLGTSEATVQTTTVTQPDISALFWLNLSLGAAATLLFASASGFLARLFHEPALAKIALVSSLTFVLTGLVIQHYALLRRAMDFRRIAMIDMAANVVSSIVAVAMAYTGWDYWALVAKPILTSMLSVVGVWFSCRWVPGRPIITPEVKRMVRFGLGVPGFTLTDYIAKSADRVALGYFYGSGPLGYFQNASLFYSNLLGILTEPLHTVAVSGLSKLKDDPAALKRSWAAALSALCFVSAPAFAILAVTGNDIIVILLGPKWAPAGPLLCVFGLRGIAHCIAGTMGWLHVVAGRTDRWMRWGFVSAGVQLFALAVGLPFGPFGVAIAYTIAMFGLFIPSVVYAGQPLGIERQDVVSAVGPQTAAALIAAASAFLIQAVFLTELSHFARLVVSILVCSTIYLALAVGVFKVRGPLKLARSILKQITSKRPAG